MKTNLSEKELTALQLVTEGLTNKQIAEEMGYSEKHIEAMLGQSDPHRSIYAKIKVKNRVEAAVWYTRSHKNKK